MKLGSLDLKNRYLLAPMLNVTTSPFRRFCRYFFNIGLVYVPMIYTKKIEKHPKSIELDLLKIDQESPIGIQLIGSDPEALKKSIDYLESYKFDILDLNAGCPSKRAIKAKEGGYLMKDLNTLNLLVKIAVKYSAKPVSLKIRTGFENPVNTKEMAQIINDSGIDVAIIHARTVKSNFREEALDLDTVKSLKEKLTIPLVGNGDIINPIIAKYFIDYTNVDGLMIGRESMGNPEIFNQIHDYFINGKEIPFKKDNVLHKKYIKIYEDKIDEYLNGISHPLGNEYIKFVELKRNAIWLSKNINNSTKIRIQISKTKNLIQLQETLIKYFNSYL
ncbi:MAG: tRNA dihydrouridine synthase [Promethearchaeota archaeon]